MTDTILNEYVVEARKTFPGLVCKFTKQNKNTAMQLLKYCGKELGLIQNVDFFIQHRIEYPLELKVSFPTKDNEHGTMMYFFLLRYCLPTGTILTNVDKL